MLTPPVKAFITAVIVADLFILTYVGGSWIVNGHVLPHKEETRIVVAGLEDAAATETAAVAEVAAFDPATYTPDVGRGEKIAAKCKACHSFDQGGPNRVGPNQWGVYGAELAHVEGFAYSAALIAKKAEVPVWDDAALNGFLESPRNWLPGTKMQFNGIKKPEERADLIAWLKTLK